MGTQAQRPRGREEQILEDADKSREQLMHELQQLRCDRALGAAAESIRAEVMTMRSCDDLAKVVVVMYREMVTLGVETPGCNIGFVDEEAGLIRHYFGLENPKKHGVSWRYEDLREIDSEVAVGIWKGDIPRRQDVYLDHWHDGTVWSVATDDRDRRYFKSLLGLNGDLPTTGAGWVLTTVPFTHGWVSFRLRSYSEEATELVKALIQTLSLGFVRYLDFQRVDEAQKKLIDELEEELRKARELQMSLMPKHSPVIAGYDIAGRCFPAAQVGGDFFQFYELPQNRLAISLADATGHAMEAAIPVVMFSGILRSQLEIDSSLDVLLERLNRSLYDMVDRRTYVCLAQGELSPSRKILRLANSGCPYPFHYRRATGVVEELRIDAYPLGVRREGSYGFIEVQLQKGDRVVFCSDGIIEAGVPPSELFGFARTSDTIRDLCERGSSAARLVDGIFGEVHAFTGEVTASDDMTCVALEVTS